MTALGTPTDLVRFNSYLKKYEALESTRILAATRVRVDQEQSL
jgi:hypothetical protein